MVLRRSPAALVMTVTVGLVDAGKAPTASMVAEETRLPLDDVTGHLEHFAGAGELRTIEGRVVAVSERMRQACGVWSSRTLGAGLKAAMTAAIDEASTETESAQFGRALQALDAIPAGVLEGVLGSFLFRFDFVDHLALAQLRSTPSSTNPAETLHHRMDR